MEREDEANEFLNILKSMDNLIFIVIYQINPLQLDRFQSYYKFYWCY